MFASPVLPCLKKISPLPRLDVKNTHEAAGEFFGEMFLCLFLVPQMKGIPRSFLRDIFGFRHLGKDQISFFPCHVFLPRATLHLHKGKGLSEQTSQAPLQGPIGTEFGRGKERDQSAPHCGDLVEASGIAALRSRSCFGDAGEIVSSPSSPPSPKDTVKWSSLQEKR